MPQGVMAGTDPIARAVALEARFEGQGTPPTHPINPCVANTRAPATYAERTLVARFLQSDGSSG
jgi:hypothetical protein